MNIQSEIEFFADLGLVDKARFVTRLLYEVAEEAKVGAGDGADEDPARPQDDVVIRMLLGARTDKNAERIMHNAYRRVLLGFESFDTTVLMNPR
jgi:hypothetical protein